MAGRLDFQAKFLPYGWQLPTVKRCSNLTDTLGFSGKFTLGGDNSCRPFDLYSLKSPSITLVNHHAYPDLLKCSQAIRKGAGNRLTWMFTELPWRNHEDGCATGQPCRGIGSEPYLNGTSQGPTPEDARFPARLRPRFQPVGLPGRRVGDYAPEGSASSSERRTAISVVAVGH